jgi:hypothetical protein
MGRRKRPPGAPKGRPGRLPDGVQSERMRITQTLCARARVVHGMTILADVQHFVISQEIWAERFAEYGAPSDTMISNVWRALNPENIDLCANLDREKVQRTASEERHAAIIRARETVNRWYAIERELILERDSSADDDDRRKLEERIGKAQERRMDAEEQLGRCIALIDDESFESAQLRSEVIGILARNRSHFTDEEAGRLASLFAPTDLDVEHEPDPDLPDYLQ